MIYPTRRAILLVAAGVPPTMLGVVALPELWGIGLAWLCGTVLFVFLDGLLGVSARRLTVAWNAPSVLYVGESDPFTIRFTAAGAERTTTIDVLLEVAGVVDRPALIRRPIDHRRDVHVVVDLVPHRRGTAAIQRLWLRWRGPFGLTWRKTGHQINLDVPVLPNIRAVRQSALSLQIRDATFGSKVQREAGSGSEFDALRDHVPGLDSRAIDWKHSARHRKLVSKEFQTERNHQIVMAIDTGRLMSEPLGGIPRLDRAINAGLVLTYTSLHAGDRVGVYGFDAQVRLFAAPTGGVRAFPRVQQSLAQLDYRDEETNFTLGLTALLGRLKQRSLVVVMTDFVDTVTAELMVENLGRMASRHLILFTVLRDPVLTGAIEDRPATLEDLSQAVIASDLARERAGVLERLRRFGVHCLEADAAKLNGDLINRYLTIKQRELI